MSQRQRSSIARPTGNTPTFLRGALLVSLSGMMFVSGCMNSVPFLSGFGKDAEAEPVLPAHEAAKVRLKTANVMYKDGKFAEALELYAAARHSDKSLKIAHKIALLHDRLGHTEHAQREYERALEERPDDPNVLNSFGRFYFDRRQWNKAEKLYRRALQLAAQENSSIWHTVGFAKKKPESKLKFLKALIWNNLGNALGQQRKYKESFQAFQQGGSLADAHCNLAFVFMTHGQQAQAMGEYQKALRLNPEHPVAQRVLKQLQDARMQTAEAKTDTQRVRGSREFSPRHRSRTEHTTNRRPSFDSSRSEFPSRPRPQTNSQTSRQTWSSSFPPANANGPESFDARRPIENPLAGRYQEPPELPPVTLPDTTGRLPSRLPNR